MMRIICETSSVVSKNCVVIRLTLFIVSEAYYGYKREDIIMLTDDSTDPRMMPTRENMVRCFYPSFVYCPILFFLAASNAMACARCLPP